MLRGLEAATVRSGATALSGKGLTRLILRRRDGIGMNVVVESGSFAVLVGREGSRRGRPHFFDMLSWPMTCLGSAVLAFSGASQNNSLLDDERLKFNGHATLNS